MPFLATLMASQRARSILGFIAAALAMLAVVGALWGLSRCSTKREVSQAVALDRADAVSEAANMIRAADAEAAMNQSSRADVLANQSKEIEREAAKGDDRSVGPGTIAVLERVRRQQAAH